MKNDRLYSTKALLGVTGETRQRIQYWILNGIVSPHDPSAGTGTTRHYSFENLLEITIAQALSMSKIDIKIVAYILKQIKREIPAFFEGSMDKHSVDNQSVFAAEIHDMGSMVSSVNPLKIAKKNFFDTLAAGNTVIYLNLDALKDKLVAKLGTSKG